jgi:hypothetical protein
MTRQSISFETALLLMDARVKPAHDELRIMTVLSQRKNAARNWAAFVT